MCTIVAVRKRRPPSASVVGIYIDRYIAAGYRKEYSPSVFFKQMGSHDGSRDLAGALGSLSPQHRCVWHPPQRYHSIDQFS